MIVDAERDRRTLEKPANQGMRFRGGTVSQSAGALQNGCKNGAKIHKKSIQNGVNIGPKLMKNRSGVLGSQNRKTGKQKPQRRQPLFRIFEKKCDFGRHFGPQWILKGVRTSRFWGIMLEKIEKKEVQERFPKKT